MSRRAKTLPEGRYWTKSQLASHFSRSIEWINKNYKRLLLQGMPDMDDLFDAWDSVAVIEWENKRSLISTDEVSRDMRQYERELANGEI